MSGTAAFESPLALAIDVGSSGVKAALFDARARRIEHTEARIAHRIHATPDGGVEELAEHLVPNVESAIDGAMRRAGPLTDLITAVGMDTMASTVLGLDSDGDPATPIYTYADTRSQREVDSIRELVDERAVHQRTGCVQHPSYLPARFMWLRRVLPDLARSVRTWVDPGTYLYRRWFDRTDVPVSYSLASWTGMLDRHNLEWDEDLMRLAGLDASALPSLAEHTRAVVGLAEPFASRWPALRDVPFYLAVGDGASANVGSGCVGPGRAALTVGTSGALRVLVPDPSPAVPYGLWGYRLANDTLVGGALSDGGSVVEWARDTLRLPDDHAEMDQTLSGMAPAAHGLVALPFLSGERSPGWAGDARAAFAGLSMATTPAEMLQAALEATAYRFGKVWRLLRPHASGDAVVVASGGAIVNSRYLLQLMADVLGCEVIECLEAEATSRGTAILALKAAGVWTSLDDVPPSLGESYGPDFERSTVYAKDTQKHDRLYGLLVGKGI